MGTMTKADIVNAIIIQTGQDRRVVTEFVEMFIEAIKEHLEKGEDISLSGFGRFSVRSKHERNGRNPKTGEEIKITPRRVVTFSLSNVLRSKLTNPEND
jgi:integration host factor subunit alpha